MTASRPDRSAGDPETRWQVLESAHQVYVAIDGHGVITDWNRAATTLRRQARRMYDARELTVAQIGEVLGVSRTAIYRALAQDGAGGGAQAAAPAGSARAGQPAGESPCSTPAPAPSGVAAAESVAAAVKGRRHSSRPWFLVKTDVKDPAGPVVVVSRYASERAARAALVRARNKQPEERGAVLEVRTGEQIGSRLQWDADLGRAVVREGPPRP